MYLRFAVTFYDVVDPYHWARRIHVKMGKGGGGAVVWSYVAPKRVEGRYYPSMLGSRINIGREPCVCQDCLESLAPF